MHCYLSISQQRVLEAQEAASKAASSARKGEDSSPFISPSALVPPAKGHGPGGMGIEKAKKMIGGLNCLS